MKFVNKKCFPLVVGISIALVIGFFVFLCGFHIAYALELENSWDAISAVGTLASAVIAAISTCASFLAVWYAIKISEKDAKINLFDKRYVVYKTLENCKLFYESLDDLDDMNSIQTQFLSTFDKENTLKSYLQLTSVDAENNSVADYTQYFKMLTVVKCKEVISTLKETKFLFTEDPKIFEYSKEIAIALSGFLISFSELSPSEKEAAKVNFQAVLLTRLDVLLGKISQIIEL